MSDTEKMTDAEFAAKADYEGVDYAVLDYGLRSKHLADTGSELHRAMVAVEKLLPAWRDAMGELEAVIEGILDSEEQVDHAD